MRGDRNKCKGGIGGIFCEGCGLMFTDERAVNISNYKSVKGSPCRKHRGLKGYSLLTQLEREEARR